MSIKKLFFRDTIIYGLSSYLGIIAGLILTPVYTRYFSKVEYGEMDLLNTWNNFIMLIIPLGITTSILRNFNQFDKDESEKRDNLGTLFLFLILSSFCYILLHLLGYSLFDSYYFKGKTGFDLILVSFGIIIFTVLTGYFQSINRIKFQVYKYLAINTIPFIIMVIFGYYFSITLKMRTSGFFYAGFLSSFIGFLLALVLGREFLYIRFNYIILKSTLKYTLPLVFVLVFVRFTTIVDRVLINNFLDLTALGEYSVVTRISNLLQIVVSAFTAAWLPYAMKKIDDDDSTDLYMIAYKYYLMGFAVLSSSLIIFSKELLLIFAPDYLNVEYLIYILVPITVMGGLSYFFGLGMHIVKKTKYFIYSSFISFIVNVFFSSVLSYYLGIIGIIIGSFLAILSWISVEYYFSKKISGLEFNFSWLFAFLGTMIFVSFLTMGLNKLDNMFISILIKSIAVVLTFGMLFLDQKIRNFIKSKISSFNVK